MRIPFLRPKAAPAPPPRARQAAQADAPTDVQAARTQARRRLVGAVVLLLIGVVGFPVLFETQPRPLPLDTPIELPRRESVTSGLTGADIAPLKPQPAPLPVLPADAGTEEAPAPAAAPAASAVQAPVQLPQAVTKPVEKVAIVPASAPAAMPVPVPVPPPKATAAAASGSPAETARYVVQAGAYSEAGKLHEARAKLEKLGLKTYTQVVESDKGPRTRIRVGPYATRAEAETVAAKVRNSGLPAALLTL